MRRGHRQAAAIVARPHAPGPYARELRLPAALVDDHENDDRKEENAEEPEGGEVDGCVVLDHFVPEAEIISLRGELERYEQQSHEPPQPTT